MLNYSYYIHVVSINDITRYNLVYAIVYPLAR